MKNKAKMILKKLLFPEKWVLIFVPPLSFAALAVIFAYEKTESAAAYAAYFLSAYSLTIWSIALPRFLKCARKAVENCGAVQKFKHSKIGEKYLGDINFRGSVSIYQGMAANYLYVIFRFILWLRYGSVWFISIAIYYLVLGCLRARLIVAYGHKNPEKEIVCYRQTAWLLFLLNITMGGMIVQMVRANSGFSYPGVIIYLSAMYTFYIMILSVINLVKFRRVGSPVLSAAKVLNFISAMMSVLALQTAMISRFSNGDETFRKTMNTITGSAVYAAVIAIAVYMLLHSGRLRKQVKVIE